jgi:hydrogenase expression/formation protein HypD
MGSEYFSFVPEKYNIPAVISGFEYVDVATAVYYLFEEVQKGEKNLINLYPKYVKPQGNINAKELLEKVFKSKEGHWRGIGTIDFSELTLKNEFLWMDAAKSFDIRIKNPSVSLGCQCGDIITGNKSPFQCSLFCGSCTPEDPRGPCMVSSEGACAIYYKYKRGNFA